MCPVPVSRSETLQRLARLVRSQTMAVMADAAGTIRTRCKEPQFADMVEANLRALKGVLEDLDVAVDDLPAVETDLGPKGECGTPGPVGLTSPSGAMGHWKKERIRKAADAGLEYLKKLDAVDVERRVVAVREVVKRQLEVATCAYHHEVRLDCASCVAANVPENLRKL